MSSSFGCISALLADFNLRHTVLFRSFLHHIPLNNTPSLDDDAEVDCPPAVEDDSDCSGAAAAPVSMHSRASFGRFYTDYDDTHIIARKNVSFTTIRIPKPSPFGCVYTDCDAQTTHAAAAPLDASDAAVALRAAPSMTFPSAPAALCTGTGADDGPVDDAKLVASATSIRQTGVSEMNE